MARPTKVVVNCETGSQEVIELTDAEIAELEAAAVKAAEEKAAAEAEAQAKAAAKQAAQDKLKALGLSDLEVAALVGA